MTAPHSRHLAVLAAIAVTAAVALTPLLGSPAQAAASPTNIGLYGSGDPTYDGVFRQSLAILGLHAAGKTPDPAAISWLLDQQCADGGFSSYNPSPAKGCPKYDPSAFTGGTDTNATSLAVQALLATGHSTEAVKAAKLLRAAQDKDGGWPFIVGGGTSDPNSTGLVMSALAAAGDAVDSDGAAYLAGLQLGCGTTAQPTDVADRGGFATPYSNGAPDVLGTVQAVPGLEGLNLARPLPPAGPWPDGGDALPCAAPSPSTSTSTAPSPSASGSASGPVSTGDVAGWAATWLAGQVDAKAVTGSNVGWAILSFASTHTHHDAAVALYGSLTTTLATARSGSVRGAARAFGQSTESPGALALAALSAQTLGHPTTAKGYATRISATLTAGTASTSPSVSATSSHSASASPSTTSSGASSGSGSSGTADPTLPATGGQPYVVLDGVLLLATGAGLIGLARRRRT